VILNPIIPIHGTRERRFILRQTESVAAVVAASQRGIDHAAIIARLHSELPRLRDVWVVGERSACATPDPTQSSIGTHRIQQEQRPVVIIVQQSRCRGIR
jgi:hypothetical protein